MKDSKASHDLPRLPDFGDENERRRLGPAGLKAFVRIAGFWRLSADDGSRLLALPAGTNIGDVDPTALSQEQMFRISFVLGIYKALHIVYEDKLADAWISLSNTNAIFGGQTPAAYMIQGGLEAMRTVHQLLEARAAGN